MWFLTHMKFIADLHIHSRFSRATSKALDLEHLSLWACKKGIEVVGTGDFTHPGWIAEVADKLVEAPSEGLYQLRPEIQRAVERELPPACPGPSAFLLTGEISCIYKKDGRTRKLHHLILMPDLDAVDRLNQRLGRIGNIASDGRPILGLDSKDLLEIVLETSEKAFFIPAHIWTPWFSLFGSRSGFETIEACFEDLTGHIHALETGLSSDPPMNRRLSALDPYLLVSNSDAHSAAKLGREANLFNVQCDYPHMIEAMTTGNGFEGTIEFFPQEGKYHLDGHRNCGVRLHPEETARLKGICPVCGRPLTVGVLNRTYELSDRSRPRLSKGFHSLIPLPEILSEILGCGPATQKTMRVYEALLADLGPELRILMEVPIDRIGDSGGPLLAEAIRRMRSNQVICDEGYDGRFGTIRLFRDSEKAAALGQAALFADLLPKPHATAPAVRLPGKRKPLKTDQGGQLPHGPGDPIMGPLNPEQRTAVLGRPRHLLIVAGPGTGKTLTLTHRVARLIQEGSACPEKVLCLTFTRKAAHEMEERIARLVPDSGTGRIRVATFHRFCLDLLREHLNWTDLPSNFALCSEMDRETIARSVLQGRGHGRPTLTRFLRAIWDWRAGRVFGSARRPDEEDVLLPLVQEYQRILREANMVDLDELETEALRLLQDRPEACTLAGRAFRWIFVDEYQDTNPVQVEVLKGLVQGGDSHVCAIGDPDQAIYGFRGADVGSFHRFAQDFPGAEQVVLTRNYRSAPPILEGAAGVMGKDRPLTPHKSGGVPISLAACRTESEEAEMIVEQIERLMGGISHFSMDSGRVASHEGEGDIGFGDIGVLYRLNAQGDAIEEALNRAGIPCVRSGDVPLASRYPVDILWRYLQTLCCPESSYYAHAWDQVRPRGAFVSGMREDWACLITEGRVSEILKEAAACLGPGIESDDEAKKALSRLKDLADRCEGDLGMFLDQVSLERGIDHTLLEGDRVALMSLHAAKGLEWEAVFIAGCEDGILPCLVFGDRDLAEEARLFYVGMTRARSRLVLSYAHRRFLNGRALDMGPSPFLELIPESVRRAVDRRGRRPKKPALRQLTLF